MANPTALSEMAAMTIDSRTKKIADNVSSTNLILSTVATKTFSGGTSIIEEFSFQENQNTGSYAGSEALPTGTTEDFGAAQYKMKMYASAVSMSGEERLMNSGPEAMIDLVASRVDLAEVSLKNRMVRDLYGDGTGNNGKNITGLQAAIPLLNTTGVYGGIDRSVLALWRPYSIATSSSGGVATSANILGYFYKMWANVARGQDTPDIIMVDTNYWQLFQSALQAQQRFSSPEKGEAGFTVINFQGADVCFDHSSTGIPASTAYFINSKYFRLRPHADRNFVSLGKRMSTNQDADTQFIAWAGNLTCRGQRFQGIIQG